VEMRTAEPLLHTIRWAIEGLRMATGVLVNLIAERGYSVHVGAFSGRAALGRVRLGLRHGPLQPIEGGSRWSG
jgi:hypothetical protein